MSPAVPSHPRPARRAAWRTIPALLVSALLATLAACTPDATVAPAPLAPAGPSRLVVPAASYTQVVAAKAHSCALTDAGAISCWGSNGGGQLNAPAGTGYQQLSARDDYSCALSGAGGVSCWGDDYSQYGVVRDAPSATGYVQVSAGASHACALTSAGAVTCWGDSAYGERDIPAGVTFRQVAAGYIYTCGLTSTGAIDCWGYNGQGQTNAPTGTGYSQISAGYAHACALTSAGAISCWGYGSFNQLNPPAGTGYTQLSAGADFTCAVSSAGALACWGSNSYNRATPPGGTGYVQVGAGSNHACAVTSAGGITCWGANGAGQATPPTKHVAPTATFSAPSSATVGQRFSLSLSNAQVPGYPAATPFTYAFDCGDGQGYTAASPNATAACPTTAAGSRQVRGKVIDQDGDTASYAATVAVNKAAQTVAFTSVAPSPAYVGTTYAPTAAATSGLAAAITSQTPATCTIANGTVSFVAVGACTLAADQGGDATYSAAPTATQTTTVMRRSQAITFAPLPAAPKAGTTATLAATGGASGSAVTFSSLTPAVCTVSGSTVSYAQVGSCTVAADQAGTAAYDPAPRATQTVTVGSRYAFGGFQAPVAAAPTLNGVNPGQAVPLSFSLGGNYGLQVLAAGSPSSRQIACDAGAPSGAAVPTATAGQSGLTYDPSTGRYTYVWKTEKSWAGSCRELMLTLSDGATYTARFRFK